MFLTLTLGSYGRVTSEGTPVYPDSYDYRRAALDALHFPKLVDRFWQNLRRCAGYRVAAVCADLRELAAVRDPTQRPATGHGAGPLQAQGP